MLATRFSRSDVPCGRRSPECWQSPWLPAGARRLPGFGRRSDTQANPRTRRPRRRRFAASIETPHAIGFCEPRDSWNVLNSLLDAAGVQPPALHRSPAEDDRISTRPEQSPAFVQLDPTAACLSAKQRECRNRSVSASWRNRSTFHFLPHFPTLSFALFAFMEVLCAL